MAIVVSVGFFSGPVVKQLASATTTLGIASGASFVVGAVGTVGVILSQALETSKENARQKKASGLMKALLMEAHVVIFA